MKNKILGILLLNLFSSIAFCHTSQRDTIHVYFLGGQSNMVGYGHVSELPDSLKKSFKNVWIFHGNTVADEQTNGGLGKWELLKPGHGTGFSSDGVKNSLSDRFGIELSFATELQKLYPPNTKIGLIKYARGGSSIDSLAANVFGSWDVEYKGKTGINQYDNFLKTVKNANETHDINGDGVEDVLVVEGIIWMQGESDGDKTEEIAAHYYSNLKRLMYLIRASFLSDDIPIVIGKISDSWNNENGKVWKYGELIQYAQEKFARDDKNTSIVRSTRYYKYSDQWHYNSDGYIDLGKKFANAVFLLKP